MANEGAASEAIKLATALRIVTPVTSAISDGKGSNSQASLDW
jgi:hypothetical protein